MSHYISRPVAALYIQRKHTLNLKQVLAENYFSCCEIQHFFFLISLPHKVRGIVSCGNSLTKFPRGMQFFSLSGDCVTRPKGSDLGIKIQPKEQGSISYGSHVMESSAVFSSVRFSSGLMCCQSPFVPGIHLIEGLRTKVKVQENGKTGGWRWCFEVEMYALLY